MKVSSGGLLYNETSNWSQRQNSFLGTRNTYIRKYVFLVSWQCLNLTCFIMAKTWLSFTLKSFLYCNTVGNRIHFVHERRLTHSDWTVIIISTIVINYTKMFLEEKTHHTIFNIVTNYTKMFLEEKNTNRKLFL